MPRIDDAARVEDRHSGDGGLDPRGQRHVDARAEAHVRHRRGLQRVRVGAATDDRQEIDEPGPGEALGDRGHVLGAEAARGELVARDASAHDEVRAHPPADLGEDFQAEAHPIVEAAAVLVEPLVEHRRPELVDQVVVRHRDLDAVEPAVAAAPRRFPEGPRELGDLLRLQLVGDLAMHALGDLRRRQQDVAGFRIGLGAAAEVSQLGEDEAVVPVHRIGERPVGGDDGVVVVGDLLPRRGRRGRMHARRAAEDRQRAAAPRLGFVVASQPLGGPAALGHRLGVTGRVDPVLQREAPDPGRREERPELVSHRRILALDGRRGEAPAAASTLAGCKVGARERRMRSALAGEEVSPWARGRFRCGDSWRAPRRWSCPPRACTRRIRRPTGWRGRAPASADSGRR